MKVKIKKFIKSIKPNKQILLNRKNIENAIIIHLILSRHTVRNPIILPIAGAAYIVGNAIIKYKNKKINLTKDKA